MSKPVDANNKGIDKHAHPHSLISAFVVHCLDSIIPISDGDKDVYCVCTHGSLVGTHGNFKQSTH